MKKYITIIGLLFAFVVSAQKSAETLTGQVYYLYEEEKIALQNIYLFWDKMPEVDAVSDENGNFEIPYHASANPLVVEFDGFSTQEITVNSADEVLEVVMEFDDGPKQLSKVEVTNLLSSMTLNVEDPQLSFLIGEDEFLKAACCNLSESFETNPAVDVAYNDAVTGTKEIILLGLNQKYTSYSVENIADLRGLATYDGLEFIPGRWVSSLELAKGTASASSFYDAITGAIDVSYKKFDEKPENELNFYINQNLRSEMNFVSTQQFSKNATNSLYLHGSGRFQKVDNNKDGFRDVPLSEQFVFGDQFQYNRLKDKGIVAFLGFTALYLNKEGGQMDYTTNDRFSSTVYGVESKTNRYEAWSKIGKVFNKKGRSLGWQNQFIHHWQSQSFGLIPMSGKENSFLSRLIYEDIISNTNHKWKVGGSFLYDDFKEEYNFTDYQKTERNLGVFAEYEYSSNEKLKVLLGTRVDFNSLAGTQFSPKLHLKYLPFSKTSLRFTAGSSFRNANIWEENQRYFVSNRQVIIDPTLGGENYGLEPENAMNFGASISQQFRLFKRKSTLIADYFTTIFNQQVVADLDQSPQSLYFYNLDKRSEFQSFQLTLDSNLAKNFDVRLAYKYYNTDIPYATGNRSAPLLAEHRAFLNMEYEIIQPSNKSWSFDTTLQWVGKMRLPDTKSNPIAYQRPDYSKSYFLLNAQINREFSDKWRLYLGAQNITSYTQEEAIIDPENPFGNYFDASMVYAPIIPINAYLGVDVSF